jgi:hypothetical protein
MLCYAVAQGESDSVLCIIPHCHVFPCSVLCNGQAALLEQETPDLSYAGLSRKSLGQGGADWLFQGMHVRLC